MAEQLILFQTDELSGVKAKYNGLAGQMETLGDNLRTAEGRLNSCLSAMESVVGSGGGAGYFYDSTWAGGQYEGMKAILTVIAKAIDLTAETDGSLKGRIAGTQEGAVAAPVAGSGDTSVQTVTATAGVAASAAAIAGAMGGGGIVAGTVFAGLGAALAALKGSGAGSGAGGAGTNAPGTAGGGTGTAGAAAGAAGAAGAAAAKPEQTTIGKNMDRKTSIKTKSSSGKTVTVKGTYDVVKNVDKFTLDQRKYGSSTCTGTAWAMTRNINDGKTTIKPLDKSNWGSSGCKWPGSTKVTGSNQNMLSAAYKQLQQGKVCTIYGKHPVNGASTPHAVTIVGVKPTANPKNLQISDFLVIDPWGGTTKNMSDVKYTKLTGVFVDKT